MRIRLSVIAQPDTVPATPGDIVLDESGGIIGRHPDSDWVLPDPDHFVSGRHACIEFVGGAFTITDTSANGLFINESESPLGKGNQARLNDGDLISVGDYEIRVALEREPVAPERPRYEFAELAGAQQAPSKGAPQPPAGPAVDLNIDDIIGSRGQAADRPAAKSRPAPDLSSDSPVDSFFQPPSALPEDWDTGERPTVVGEEEGQAAPMIPDDWDKTLRGESAAPKPVPKPGGAARRAPSPPPSAPRAAPAAPAPRASAAGQPGAEQLLAQFLAGAGLDPAECAGVPAAQLLQQMGQTWRAALLGLVKILRTRAEIKNTFRLEMTRIQPKENNPLKFSLSDEQAMLSLVRPPAAGQMPPLAAIDEAVQDIQAHQMAMLAGMRSAVREVLAQFEPGALEEQIQRLGVLGSVLPAAKRAKYWEEYRKHYEQIINESNERFDQMFGQAFAEAYEEQMRFLRRAARGGSGQ